MSAHADNSAEVPTNIVAAGGIFATMRQAGRVVVPSLQTVYGSPLLQFEVLERGQVVERLVLNGGSVDLYSRALNGLLQAALGLQRREL